MPEPRAEISVRVTPRGGQNRVAVEDGKVKAWVTAPPADGQANAAVERAFADALSVAKSKVAVIRGHKSREKVVAIEGMTSEEALSRLDVA